MALEFLLTSVKNKFCGLMKLLQKSHVLKQPKLANHAIFLDCHIFALHMGFLATIPYTIDMKLRLLTSFAEILTFESLIGTIYS